MIRCCRFSTPEFEAVVSAIPTPIFNHSVKCRGYPTALDQCYLRRRVPDFVSRYFVTHKCFMSNIGSKNLEEWHYAI